jgi:acyl dehydratase
MSETVADAGEPGVVATVKPIGLLDNLTVGQEIALGCLEFTEDDILAFATRYDPLPFHVDRELAKASIFKGLIASGLHTLAAVHALSIRCGFLTGPTVIVGAGIDELRFRRPVRANDKLSVKARVLELSRSPRHKDRGVARIFYEVTNQNGEVALTFIDNHVLQAAPLQARPSAVGAPAVDSDRLSSHE